MFTFLFRSFVCVISRNLPCVNSNFVWPMSFQENIRYIYICSPEYTMSLASEFAFVILFKVQDKNCLSFSFSNFVTRGMTITKRHSCDFLKTQYVKLCEFDKCKRALQQKRGQENFTERHNLVPGEEKPFQTWKKDEPENAVCKTCVAYIL